MKITQRRLSYLAGYFDADGCVSVSLNNKTLSVKASISGRNLPLCVELKRTFGGSIGTSKNGLVTWNAYSDTAKEFLIGIYPFCGYKSIHVKMAIKILTDSLPYINRLRMSLWLCELNQGNLAKPKVTGTMKKISLHLKEVENEC